MKKVAPHHESWEKLWETKWKPLATMGVYPFMFGAAKDFEPILELMKKVSGLFPLSKARQLILILSIARSQGTVRLEHIS